MGETFIHELYQPSFTYSSYGATDSGISSRIDRIYVNLFIEEQANYVLTCRPIGAVLDGPKVQGHSSRLSDHIPVLATIHPRPPSPSTLPLPVPHWLCLHDVFIERIKELNSKLSYNHASTWTFLRCYKELVRSC